LKILSTNAAIRVHDGQRETSFSFINITAALMNYMHRNLAVTCSE